ncbi:hypothetical protein CcI49_29920 [Frankia sp. CcI49]|nr:hypothetical protein CcI49_29920 [Frankia sp. CcI49]
MQLRAQLRHQPQGDVQPAGKRVRVSDVPQRGDPEPLAARVECSRRSLAEAPWRAQTPLDCQKATPDRHYLRTQPVPETEHPCDFRVRFQLVDLAALDVRR